ncbi:hypothetical protein U1Q18_010056, partial [Sarracenia purpurea var. burkii]
PRGISSREKKGGDGLAEFSDVSGVVLTDDDDLNSDTEELLIRRGCVLPSSSFNK